MNEATSSVAHATIASTATGSDTRGPSRSRSPIDPGLRNGGTNADSARMRRPRDTPTERSEPPL